LLISAESDKSFPRFDF